MYPHIRISHPNLIERLESTRLFQMPEYFIIGHRSHIALLKVREMYPIIAN